MKSFKVLFLLLVSVSFVLMEENDSRENTKNSKFLQRRYSEGTLASDYSRTLDSMMKKNFVEWLLNRRESMTDNRIDPSRRDTELTALDTRNQGIEAGSQEAMDFIQMHSAKYGETEMGIAVRHEIPMEVYYKDCIKKALSNS
uniref:glucagon-1-like n=1 Tax=Podarcis muralis TaxID=64176 RepID=UPI00109F97AF|nr:glucagon-1-like [Podarcis muralis]